MQLAAPDTALGLLWIFPTMWLAAGIRPPRAHAVIVSIAGIVSVLLALERPGGHLHDLLLPLVLFAVATTSYLTARRSDAQRSLLAKQALLLGRVLERTRRQEQEVTEVLDAVDFGVIRIAADGKVSVTNEAHGRLQQARGAARRGRRGPGVPRRRRHPPARRRAAARARARAARRSTREVVWFGERAGAAAGAEHHARRLTDSAGEDAGAVVISRDVTTELDALRARDELVASVSHELRTPLTSILGYLDLAIEEPEHPRSRPRESRHRGAQRRAAAAASSPTSWRRPSSSSSSVEASIAAAATRCARRRARRGRGARSARRPRARSRSTRRASSRHRVSADPMRAAAGRRQPPLERDHVQPRRRDGVPRHDDATAISSWILVRDTGVGISEADRSRLFQRFYKAGRTARRSGTGLGLAHHAGTSSAPTAASSACTARPARARRSSSSCPPTARSDATRRDPP